MTLGGVAIQSAHPGLQEWMTLVGVAIQSTHLELDWLPGVSDPVHLRAFIRLGGWREWNVFILCFKCIHTFTTDIYDDGKKKVLGVLILTVPEGVSLFISDVYHFIYGKAKRERKKNLFIWISLNSQCMSSVTYFTVGPQRPNLWETGHARLTLILKGQLLFIYSIV